MLRSKQGAVTPVLLLALLWGLAPAWGQPRLMQPFRGTARPVYLKEVERRIFQLTNEVRRQANLPPLLQDDVLMATARAHSGDMLVRNFFSHVNPDGKAPQDRLAPAYASALTQTGENIWSGHGFDYVDSKLLARVIVDSWMNSPAHRANLLNPAYTRLGVGVSVLGKDIRATQDFVQRK